MVFTSDGQADMFLTSVVAAVLGIPACIPGSLLARHFLHNGGVGAVANDALLGVYLVWSYTRSLPQGTLERESRRGIGGCAVASVLRVALVAVLPAQGWGAVGLPPCVVLYLIMCVALGSCGFKSSPPSARRSPARWGRGPLDDRLKS